MKPSRKEQKHWQLSRERFHIADRRPPAARREARKIGTILSKVLQSEPVEKPLSPVFSERWSLITGEQIAKHTTPARLRNGVLYVYADHPGWLGQIRRLPKAHLLKKIAAIPETSEITDIRFQLDPLLQTKRVWGK